MTISHNALVIIIGTCIFMALGLIIVPCTFISKAHGGLIRLMAVGTAACTWLMWLMIFLSQMNPLQEPQRKEDEGACVIL
eukprot:gene3427-5972_t